MFRLIGWMIMAIIMVAMAIVVWLYRSLIKGYFVGAREGWKQAAAKNKAA